MAIGIGKLIRTRGTTTLRSAVLVAPVLTLLYFVSPLADRNAAWNSVVARETRLIPPSPRSAGAGFQYPTVCLTWFPNGEPREEARSEFYYGKGPSPLGREDALCTVRYEVYYWHGRTREHGGGGYGCSEEQAVTLPQAVDALRRRLSDPNQPAISVPLENGRGYGTDRDTPPDPRIVGIVNAAAAGHSYKEIVLVRALQPDGKGWRIQAFDRSNLPPEVQAVLARTHASRWQPL